MSAYFTNRLTRPAGLGLLQLSSRRVLPGRAARGSVAPRKMACPLARGGVSWRLRLKAINSRTGEGQPWSLPLLIGSKKGACFAPRQSGLGEMNAKTTHDLVLLAALSLFCATVAWSEDHAVFASVFLTLTAVAAFNAVAPRPRR
jgi:hypothetical protein